MSPTSDQKSFEQRLRDAGARAEEELRRVVRYLDDEVVPEVRRNSSTALRSAATRLQKLADSMDETRRSASSGGASTGTGTSEPGKRS